MKAFLITFGLIITLFILIFGTQGAINMYSQIEGNPEFTNMLIFVYLVCLALGLILLIAGLNMKKSNDTNANINNIDKKISNSIKEKHIVNTVDNNNVINVEKFKETLSRLNSKINSFKTKCNIFSNYSYKKILIIWIALGLSFSGYFFIYPVEYDIIITPHVIIKRTNNEVIDNRQDVIRSDFSNTRNLQKVEYIHTPETTIKQRGKHDQVFLLITIIGIVLIGGFGYLNEKENQKKLNHNLIRWLFK